DNPMNTAGATFMGQFIDHDITMDAGSRLGRPESVRRSMNLRTGRLDLDSVYGGGPAESPELYSTSDQLLFNVESGGRFEDLPRDNDGAAIVADGRNDENLIIAGLQVAFLLAHTSIVERTRSSELGDPNSGFVFAEAQRVLRWHYQWIVLRELLPQFVGAVMVNDVLTNGRRYYTPDSAQIPVEFQTSAYRFGHSMVRPSYRANLAGDNGEPFFGFVFDPTEFDNPDPADLNGGSRAPRRFIGWQTFFDFADGEVKPNKRIDTKLSTPLFQLPMGAISTVRGEPIGPMSLATRNLLRHITWGIPSGQQLAEVMSTAPLAADDLADVTDISPELGAATPLWLYVLREAEVVADGLHLGPVGGRIVAEVLIGLLELDPTSFLNVDPTWRPTLPSRLGSGEFAMADLLTVAGVDPESRGE
ncbi:MAG: peroxidase family protein, partial [Acidimicrobiales bacterium]